MDEAGKKSLILNAALELFTAQGFHGTAVPEIARRAGVGTGTIYRYFPDKEGLVNALYRLWRARLNAEALAPMPTRLEPREQFDLYWGRLVGFAREAPLAARFLALHHHDAYLDEDSRHLARVYSTATRSFVKSGISSGALAPMRPEVAVALIEGTLTALIRQDEEAAAQGRSALDDEVIAEAGARLWAAIAAPAQERAPMPARAAA
jgi:AcrR family transcriptional regulator